MIKIKIFFALSAMLFLASCISGSDITLIDVKSGTVATASDIRFLHIINIEVNGKEYSGSFTYAERPHDIRILEQDSIISDGTMVAKADDGSTLTCTATFEGWSNTGNGLCHDDDNHTYDLIVSTRY